ncbi:phage portal protein [Pediococcus acidilactici]|uniref:Phage portal protein n=1 Tax=Pediococcus acidilactici TaxID=1254 RepID=A0AAW8YT61_PEDAC|nr:phage portal protein [Pediococcus acidilactici]MDV2912195.1 phage portal protein [Pediococcus acidilactici]WQS18327.1 phage portal protein [Pediococcus acidilactici]
MTGQDVLDFILQHMMIAEHYKSLRKDYIGDHDILHKDTHRGNRPDNRLVANLAHYIVETFNGFFIGIPPKITLDDKQDNEKLKQWNDKNSFQDKLSEISRQVDIYGRSIAFLYQDEDSETRVQYASPLSAFIIYDDTVDMNPIAFVNYYYINNRLHGQVITNDIKYDLSDTFKMDDGEVNQFGTVPAVEFFQSEDRQGVLDNVQTLIDALDNTLSQKANQVEYFDNAYLAMLGVQLEEDEEGNPKVNLEGQQIIYSPDADATNAKLEFLSKPDGDNMQENLIDRITNLTYQISMVSNLNDEAFAGNSSGVAMQYKLLPMRNLAMNKERKFTQSLRQLYKLLFGIGTVLDDNKKDEWQNLSFKFSQNIPANLADEAATAKSLEGITSKETQLSALSIVDDPKNEIDRMKKEQSDAIKNSLEVTGNLTDQQKAGMNNESETAEQEE